MNEKIMGSFISKNALPVSGRVRDGISLLVEPV